MFIERKSFGLESVSRLNKRSTCSDESGKMRDLNDFTACVRQVERLNFNVLKLLMKCECDDEKNEK